MAAVGTTVLIEDAKLINRNFRGEKSAYNMAGESRFCVILPPEVAEKMIQDDWNVKLPKELKDGGEGDYFIQVSLGYKIKPPRVVLITENGKVNLTESMLEVLDWADIEYVDVLFAAGNWEVGDKSGTKAWLRTIVVKINEDPLERKWALNEGEVLSQVGDEEIEIGEGS